MGCVQMLLMLSCVVRNVIAVFKNYNLSVILKSIIYIILSSCKECVILYEFCIQMRTALYVEEDILFTGYLRLFCNGRPESFRDHCLKIGHAPLSLNPLNPELNSICYLLALLAHHFLHVSRIRVQSLNIRLLMSYIYIYGAPILDVSRSHTTTQHSR